MLRRTLLPLFCAMLAWVLLAAPGQAAQGTTGRTAVAQDVVDDLIAQEFGAVVARFDDTMRAGLPEGELADTWNHFVEAGGPATVDAGASVTSVPDGEYGVVDLPVLFGDLPATVRVTVDGDLRIAGLFILERGVPFPARPEPLVGWLLLGAGALIVIVGVLGGIGRLPKNRLAGIRLPSTLRSKEAWDRAHRAAAVPTVAAGVVLGAAGPWYLWGGADEVGVLVLTGVGTVIMLVAGLVGHLAATRRV